MDHQKKLDFVLKMTKHALEHVQHFDDGGTTVGGPVVSGQSTSGTSSGVHGLIPSYGTTAGDALPVLGAIGSGVNALGAATQNNFQATGAVLQPGTNASQINASYNNAQSGLGQQQAFANQLSPGGAQGAGAQAGLSQQLQNQSMGQGPNPAQAALNQQTGRNISQQAALAAGQRGAGQNAGALASNNARQGSEIQQQAVGQGATLQAQQQLAAQQQLQGLSANQINQQGQAITGFNTAGQNEQNILQNANNAYNTSNVAMQSNLNNVNAGISQGNQAASNNLLGGLLSGSGTALSSFAKGGMVGMPDHLMKMHSLYHGHHYDEGGDVQVNEGKEDYTAPTAATSPNIGSVSPADEGNPFSGGGGGGSSGGGSGAGLAMLAAAHGGKVPNVGQKLKSGGSVPGKPKVDHDAYKNDTVSAKLSPGEVVIDLNTLKDKGKLGQMARFVAANIERKKSGRKL